MKHVVGPVVAAALVSVVFNLGLQMARERQSADFSAQEIDKLATAVGENISSIASLRSELREIRSHLTRYQGPATGKGGAAGEVAVDDLVARIDAIENSVERLSEARPDGSLPGKDGGDGLSRYLIENTQSATQTTAEFESDFESDSGKPLGDFPDSIDEALHAIEDLEVRGVECRNTICKVAYSRPESLESPDTAEPENELVDRLALSAPGREVQVRYDKDTYGGDIMYIRLR